MVATEDKKTRGNLKEVQWPKAYSEQATFLLDSILGDNFQMVDASGEWSTKAKELEWVNTYLN